VLSWCLLVGRAPRGCPNAWPDCSPSPTLSGRRRWFRRRLPIFDLCPGQCCQSTLLSICCTNMRPHARPSFGSSFPYAHDYCCLLELVHAPLPLFLFVHICFDVNVYTRLPSFSDVLISVFIAYLIYHAPILPLDRIAFSRLCFRIAFALFIPQTAHAIYIQFSSRMLGLCDARLIFLSLHIITSISRSLTLTITSRFARFHRLICVPDLLFPCLRIADLVSGF
jgi:hypothetical protein